MTFGEPLCIYYVATTTYTTYIYTGMYCINHVSHNKHNIMIIIMTTLLCIIYIIYI